MNKNYKKPVAEVLFFDLEEVRMLTLESKNDGNDGDMDGDSNGNV